MGLIKQFPATFACFAIGLVIETLWDLSFRLRYQPPLVGYLSEFFFYWNAVATWLVSPWIGCYGFHSATQEHAAHVIVLLTSALQTALLGLLTDLSRRLLRPPSPALLH